MTLPRFSFWSLLSVCGFGGSLALLAVASSLDPDERGFGTHEQLGLNPCTSMALTGQPCMSCGMTTAFAALLHAQPQRAVAANPAGALLCVLTLAAPFWFGHALLRGLDPLRFLSWRSGRALLVLVAVSAVAVWLARTFG